MELIYKNDERGVVVSSKIRKMIHDNVIKSCKFTIIPDDLNKYPDMKKYLMHKKVPVHPTVILENGDLIMSERKILDFLAKYGKKSSSKSNNPYVKSEMGDNCNYSYNPKSTMSPDVKKMVEYSLPPGKFQSAQRK